MWMYIIFILAFILWIKKVKIRPEFQGNVDLSGKCVIVTGANSGLGKATALGLAKRNARVIMACRNRERAVEAVKEVREQSCNNDVHFMQLDLADFESIRRFVAEFTKTEKFLHILVNNAGVMAKGKTKQGFGEMFAINHLGPFLLTNLLLPVMKFTSQYHPVRIVTVSSMFYKSSKILFDNLDPDLHNDTSFLPHWKQYGNTKLMNVYFTNTLTEKLSSHNAESNCSVTAYSVHPGFIFTNIFRSVSLGEHLYFTVFMFLLGTSYHYGSQTSLYCCLERGIESNSGGYFSNCKSEKLHEAATEKGVGEKLWKISAELCNLSETN